MAWSIRYLLALVSAPHHLTFLRQDQGQARTEGMIWLAYRLPCECASKSHREDQGRGCTEAHDLVDTQNPLPLHDGEGDVGELSTDDPPCLNIQILVS